MGDLIRNGGVPVPQVENASSAGNFVGLKGTAGGAMHVESPDGKLATAAKQDAEKTVLDSILAKLSADPATQTTLAAVLAKLSSDPATQTTLAALLTAFNAEDFASQTTLAAILAKLSADPATQTTLAALLTAFNAEDFASQTTLASVAAKLDTLIAKDYATQTTLAALKTAFDAMVSTNGIKKIEQLNTDEDKNLLVSLNGGLPALTEGTNQVGHFGQLDPTQDGVNMVGEMLNALPKKPFNRRIIYDSRQTTPGYTYLLTTNSRIIIRDLRIILSTAAGATMYCRVPNITGEASDVQAVRKPTDVYTFTTAISVSELVTPVTYKFVPWFTATASGNEHIITLKPGIAPLELPHGLSLSVYNNSAFYLAFIADIEEVGI